MIILWDEKPTAKHIIKEGSRNHVLFWDTHGVHCSTPECNIKNQPIKEGRNESHHH